MLLKHQRKTGKFETGDVASRTAAQLRQHQTTGSYMSKDKRDAKKVEIQRAHFSFGDATLSK